MSYDQLVGVFALQASVFVGLLGWLAFRYLRGRLKKPAWIGSGAPVPITAQPALCAQPDGTGAKEKAGENRLSHVIKRQSAAPGAEPASTATSPNQPGLRKIDPAVLPADSLLRLGGDFYASIEARLEDVFELLAQEWITLDFYIEEVTRLRQEVAVFLASSTDDPAAAPFRPELAQADRALRAIDWCLNWAAGLKAGQSTPHARG
ncbi:MAG: hypothetical protein N2Z59_00790 [Alteraurantiacibacter sp.]|nr:hypothetical protein [Alteraurantiacibacter sp.]